LAREPGPIEVDMAYHPDGPITEDEFVTLVAQAARIGRDRAERAIQATLQTLAERIDPGEARKLADELPDELAPWLATTTPAERFDVDEFLRRVGEREGAEVATAERHAEAVFLALERALSDKEFADLTAELPKDFLPLLPRGPEIEVISAESFMQRVADRAGIGEEEAQRATEAVLETLAMRIAGGEVDDLRVRLPIAFQPALDRGKELSGGKATRMKLDAFVRRVAKREGISADKAREHVSAVLSTLREAVGEQEFLDVTAQLPHDYTALIRPRRATEDRRQLVESSSWKRLDGPLAAAHRLRRRLRRTLAAMTRQAEQLRRTGVDLVGCR
jgi:uncharacterized protein (DUF2267 family)